ncbi:uncharacterized protein LOC6031781 [Culex quinquefasciatus]|nr:uncharacterized protein LOC6031781 [Culex quinquefasciatus]
MAWRDVMSHHNSRCCGCCCCYSCNQRQLLAVILIFTIAMGAPHSDPSAANYPAPVTTHGFFATRNNTKVTAQKGGTALLPCTVLSQTSALVSWVRRRDFQLLTVGLSTYSSDERFLVEHIRHMGHWALRIKTVRDEDQGLYECQLSVHPVQSVFVELKVVEAVADIVGAPDLHIDEGSTLRLECKLKRATEYPEYVFWYHEQNMVNFDQQNGFSVTPFQPAAGTALPGAATTTLDDDDDDGVGAVPVDLNHLGSFHHHHHHHHHHRYHHHRRRGGHNHRRLEDNTGDGDAAANADEDDDSFGLNALELMGPPGLLLPPDSGLLAETDDDGGWPLWNHTGATSFLPYSRILSPATSVLTIKGVHSKHAGNYTCAPSNTQPASITVHVLQGEKPAAMQHANRSQGGGGGGGGNLDQAADPATKAAATSGSAPVVATAAALRQLLLLMLLLLLALAQPESRHLPRRWQLARAFPPVAETTRR